MIQSQTVNTNLHACPCLPAQTPRLVLGGCQAVAMRLLRCPVRVAHCAAFDRALFCGSKRQTSSCIMDTFVSQKRTWKIWHALNLRKKLINKTRSNKQTSKWIKALNKDSFTSNKTRHQRHQLWIRANEACVGRLHRRGPFFLSRSVRSGRAGQVDGCVFMGKWVIRRKQRQCIMDRIDSCIILLLYTLVGERERGLSPSMTLWSDSTTPCYYACLLSGRKKAAHTQNRRDICLPWQGFFWDCSLRIATGPEGAIVKK